MRKIRIFFIFIFLVYVLSSCTSISDIPKILRNEKIKTTDEFLVKKREPLTEPPNAKELPAPNSSTSKDNKKEEDGIRSILKSEDKQSNESQSKASSAEQFIINQIRK